MTAHASICWLRAHCRFCTRAVSKPPTATASSADAEVTPEQVAKTAPVADDDRWPPYAKGQTVRQCLGTVLNEEWAHHRFCKRDLDKLSHQG